MWDGQILLLLACVITRRKKSGNEVQPCRGTKERCSTTDDGCSLPFYRENEVVFDIGRRALIWGSAFIIAAILPNAVDNVTFGRFRSVMHRLAVEWISPNRADVFWDQSAKGGSQGSAVRQSVAFD